MASLEADADIVVSFHFIPAPLMKSLKVSGTGPSPDVEERSQGVGVGVVLLPERCQDSHWAGRPCSGPGWGWAKLICSGRLPLILQ